ncbi:MAG: hypothetical protein CME36_10620 [unclassified Hahellaceae]|mgnify:CR=1 FL=1|nr:hypothetical protein [Hahellaceae bacterium]|tara:strand:+ start:63805 stop:64440 length:636 start_codon:yes stop_codon:yes gene_type:complete
MTPSVTEYHFFFLAQDGGENSPSAESEAVQAIQILRTLRHYLECGRLQVLTLSVPKQFAATEATLHRHELSGGGLPKRPESLREVAGLAASLLKVARPEWRLKNTWHSLQSCSIQTEVSDMTRLFVRAEDETGGSGGLLIYGALAPMPGKSLLSSAVGRQLMSVASGLLPTGHTRTQLQLLSGSRTQIEHIGRNNGNTGLQPLIVIKATAG